MASQQKKITERVFRTTGVKKASIDAQGNKNFPLITTLDAGPQRTPSVPELAERDLRLGRAVWNKYVLPNPDFVNLLFKELFSTYPDYQTMFMTMVKKNEKDLFASPHFKVHMNTRVVNKMKDIMENLDNPVELNDIMTKLGLYHAKLGVTRRHMENIQRVVITAVRVSMNKSMQADEEEAFKACLAYAFRIAIDAGEQYLEKQNQQSTPTAGVVGQ